MPRQTLLEVCCGTADDAVAAADNGGDRIELCAALELGGLTPSAGTIASVVAALDAPVLVMVRPRPGGFCYSPGELQTMVRDVQMAVEQGAAGVVFGALDRRGEVDTRACRQIVAAAGETDVVFHRAFDFVPGPQQALERLIETGCTRLLTSGLQANAAEGVALIAELIEQSAGRIEILPGGGVTAENAAEILRQTGAGQIHVGGSEVAVDPSLRDIRHIALRDARIDSDAAYRRVVPDRIRDVASVLNRHSRP